MPTATALTTSSDETLPPEVDPRLRHLPAAAVHRFGRLLQAESRARTMCDAIDLQRAEVIETRNEALIELNAFNRQNPNPVRIEENEETGGRREVPFVPPERAVIENRIKRANLELEQLAQDRQEATFGFNTSTLLDWIVRHRGQKFVAVSAPKLNISRSASLDELLAANATEQAALRDQITELKNAHLTASEAKEAMRAQVAALAERGRANLNSLFAGGAIEWPSQTVVGTSGGLQQHNFATVAEVTDALGLVAWACRDAIIAKLDGEIDRMANDKTAVAAQVRAARLQEVEGKLTELQRFGEEIAIRIERHGRVARRASFEPLILLGIEAA